MGRGGQDGSEISFLREMKAGEEANWVKGHGKELHARHKKELTKLRKRILRTGPESDFWFLDMMICLVFVSRPSHLSAVEQLAIVVNYHWAS